MTGNGVFCGSRVLQTTMTGIRFNQSTTCRLRCEILQQHAHYQYGAHYDRLGPQDRPFSVSLYTTNCLCRETWPVPSTRLRYACHPMHPFLTCSLLIVQPLVADNYAGSPKCLGLIQTLPLFFIASKCLSTAIFESRNLSTQFCVQDSSPLLSLLPDIFPVMHFFQQMSVRLWTAMTVRVSSRISDSCFRRM